MFQMLTARMLIRTARFVAGFAACTALLPTPALAQDSSKPLTLVVPFAPGGGVDVTARLLAEKLRISLKQNVIVENKAGGSGMIGTLAVVRAPADGNTLLIASAGETAINPHVYKARMQYTPDKDLAPITMAVRVPSVLVVNPKLPINTVADLVSYAKSRPGKVSYGSSGIGNAQHLAGELLEQMTGTFLIHIPYRGASAQLTDTAGGTVDFTFVSLAGAMPFIRDGRVRALGMTSPTRFALAPDLPAIAETKGLAGYALENWFGVFAPAATPPAVQQKLNAAITAALKEPDLVKRMQDLGTEPAPMTQEQFRAFLKTESQRLAKIVDTAKITPDN